MLMETLASFSTDSAAAASRIFAKINKGPKSRLELQLEIFGLRHPIILQYPELINIQFLVKPVSSLYVAQINLFLAFFCACFGKSVP